MNLEQEDNRRELGRRIQTAIFQADFGSLAEFAEALGCSRPLIYKYIGGDILPPLDSLGRIAELTDRSIEWFISDDPDGDSGEVRRLQDRLSELQRRCEELEGTVGRERGERLRDADAARRSLLEALQQLCRAQRASGDMHGLMGTAARCADVARALSNNTALAIAHLQTGHAACALGDREKARESLETALEMAETMDDETVELSARQELVRVLQASGRLQEAEHQAVKLMDADRWWPQWAGWVALAGIAEQRGSLREAEEALDQAESVIRRSEAPEEHVPAALVYLQSNRTNIALSHGHYARALDEADRLQKLAAEASLPDQVREATLDRAIATMRNGDLERADELFDRLRDAAEMAGDRRLQGLVAAFEAERLVRAGDAAPARGRAMDAIEMGTEAVSGQVVAEGELALGTAAIADGLLDDARRHLDKCRERAQRLQLRRVEAAAGLHLARAMAAGGEDGAPEALHEAREMARDHDFEDLIVETELALSEITDESAEDALARAAEIAYTPLSGAGKHVSTHGEGR